jgi:hypothetical protein
MDFDDDDDDITFADGVDDVYPISFVVLSFNKIELS